MKDIPLKADNVGDTVAAAEYNSATSEEKNLVTSSGQTLNESDNYQVPKAVAIYSATGDFYLDSGSVNNYLLSASGGKQNPPAYYDGMTVRFRALNTNTSSATANVASLGAKQIKDETGLMDIKEGDIPAGQLSEFVFNQSLDVFELYSHRNAGDTFQTADNLWTDASGARPGWIWVNDSTKTRIGDSSSGSVSSIRANNDCEALFLKYWNERSNLDCPVIGGRGVSASADWLAHKQITIPASFRSVFAAHDISDPTLMRLGQVEGSKTQVLSKDQNGEHQHGYRMASETTGGRSSGDTRNTFANVDDFNTADSGLGHAHNNMQPTVYKNLYIKL
jgi:hypothetical protein